jgi:type II secretion system protein H
LYWHGKCIEIIGDSTIADNWRPEMRSSPNKDVRNREAGFSIVELMVVVVIMTIVLAASIPALRQHSENLNLTKGATEVEGTLKLARARAVSSNRPVVVVFDVNDGTYFLFQDDNGDGNHDSGETQSGVYEMPNKVTLGTVSFARNTVTFEPSGAASETGSVELVNTRHLAQRVDLTAATGLVYVSDVYEYEGGLARD